MESDEDYKAENIASPAWDNLKSHVHKVDEQFRLTEKLESVKLLALEHPYVTLCLSFTLAFCLVPIAAFVCFAVGSLLVTFIGFVIFEGTLLTVGVVVLGCTLCFTALAALGVSIFLLTSWMALNVALGVAYALREYIADNVPSFRVVQFKKEE